MMTKALIAEFTKIAADGYFGTNTSPYLATSNSDSAFRVGRWLRETGRTAPRSVRPSRGYLLHVNEMIVDVSGEVIERIS